MSTTPKVYIVWKTTSATLLDQNGDDAYVRACYPVRVIVGVFAHEVTARCVLAGRVDPDEKLELEECEVRQ